MDRLRLMTSFVTVVRTGSFTAAAKQLNSSPSVITRHIGQLEQYLGARLLNRTTQQFSITESGEKYHRFCIKTLGEMRRAEASLVEDKVNPRGTLRILAPKSFGSDYLAPAVAAFALRYPEVNISLVLDDQSADLGRLTDERFDIAVRTAPTKGSSLVCRTLATLRWIVGGTPEFFARNSKPKRPSDLAHLPCLFFGTDAKNELVFHGSGGQQRVVVSGPIRANSAMVLRTAALAGVGLLICPVYSVAADLKSGALVEVLKGHSLKPNVLSIVYARDPFMPARLSALIDFLCKWYEAPAWDSETIDHAVVRVIKPLERMGR